MNFKGKVTASKLNLRSLPSSAGTILDTISKETIVEILDTTGGWNQIAYNGLKGFVSSDYLDILESEPSLKAMVFASKLNVRKEPSGQLLGELKRDAIVDVYNTEDGWAEVSFNGDIAYVSSDYLKFTSVETNKTGAVTAKTLNVRSKPSTNSDVIGTLSESTEITILSEMDSFYEILFNDINAFVHSDFIELTNINSDHNNEEKTELIPEVKHIISGSSTEKKVARTWNKFGGLLESLSGSFGIDPGTALAVLCVESSGKGFEKQNDNRMIIRFENHLFWKYWGKHNSEQFHRHFQYGKTVDGKRKVWLGHTWRKSVDDEFATFHGSQSKEWDVLDYARSIDNDIALNCISMGAPQIMGFHAKKIGYKSTQDMFESFSSDISGQIEGMFNFFDKRMISALKEKDFVRFAGYYNGSGQKVKYGGWIQNHYDAYERLS